MRIEDCYVGKRVIRTLEPRLMVAIGDVGTIVAFARGGTAFKVAFDDKSDEDNAFIYERYSFYPENFDSVEELVLDLNLNFDELMGYMNEN